MPPHFYMCQQNADTWDRTPPSVKFWPIVIWMCQWTTVIMMVWSESSCALPEFSNTSVLTWNNSSPNRNVLPKPLPRHPMQYSPGWHPFHCFGKVWQHSRCPPHTPRQSGPSCCSPARLHWTVKREINYTLGVRIGMTRAVILLARKC